MFKQEELDTHTFLYRPKVKHGIETRHEKRVRLGQSEMGYAG